MEKKDLILEKEKEDTKVNVVDLSKKEIDTDPSAEEELDYDDPSASEELDYDDALEILIPFTLNVKNAA